MNKDKKEIQVRIQRGIPVWGFINLRECYKKFKNLSGKIEDIETKKNEKTSSIQLEIKKIRYLGKPPATKKSMGTECYNEWIRTQTCNKKWMKKRFGQDFRWYLSKSIMIEIAARREESGCIIFEKGLLYIFESGFIAVDFLSPPHRLGKFTANKIDRFNEVREILEHIYRKLSADKVIIETEDYLQQSSFIERIKKGKEKGGQNSSLQLSPSDVEKLMMNGGKGAHTYHHIRIKQEEPNTSDKATFYRIGKFHLCFEYSFIKIFSGNELHPAWDSKDISRLAYGIIRILALRSWISRGIQSCQIWLSLLSSLQDPAIVGQAMDHLPTLDPFEWYHRYRRRVNYNKVKTFFLGTFYATGSVPLRLIYNKDLRKISTRIRDSYSIAELAIQSIGDYTRIFSDHRLYNQIISSVQFAKILKAVVERRQIDSDYSIYQSAVGDVSRLVTSVQRYLSNSQRLIQEANAQVTGQFIRIGSFIVSVSLTLFFLNSLLF